MLINISDFGRTIAVQFPILTTRKIGTLKKFSSKKYFSNESKINLSHIFTSFKVKRLEQVLSKISVENAIKFSFRYSYFLRKKSCSERFRSYFHYFFSLLRRLSTIEEAIERFATKIKLKRFQANNLKVFAIRRYFHRKICRNLFMVRIVYLN